MGRSQRGEGSIRDVEFTVQYLQLIHGGTQPEIRTANTLDGLVRLVEHDLLFADEYRLLSSAYVFLRTIEHALQLTHYKQIHQLPTEPRELAYLARKLDFPDAETFVSYYDRHCATIRRVYEKYVVHSADTPTQTPTTEKPLLERIAEAQPNYASTFSIEEIQVHSRMLDEVGPGETFQLKPEQLDDDRWKLTMVGRDIAGQFSVTCGLLFAYGYDIIRGNVFTGLFPTQNTPALEEETTPADKSPALRFVAVLIIQPPLEIVPEEVWLRYKQDLQQITASLVSGGVRDAQGFLAKRIGRALQVRPTGPVQLLPVQLGIDNETDPEATVMDIAGEDWPGFLYELTTGLALCGMQIRRVIIDSNESGVADRLYVTNTQGQKITDESQLQALRAAVVLIKHFAHLLPGAPNPESALLHFRDLLEQLFDQPDWVEQLSSLEKPKVLDALARILGVSDFLWEDFLRLQYSNLFPVITDIESLSIAKDRQTLADELRDQLQGVTDRGAQIERLNAFKDREMLRADMRHILGYEETFGQFSLELTNIAEVVIAQAAELVWTELVEKFGCPRLKDQRECPFAIAALGKCGGQELGFASDIELMFVYAHAGMTDGKHATTNSEFFHRFFEGVRGLIRSKRDGIFEIDLRLRPYGKAGSLAISLETFESYFAPDGPAWPYERQALVKLRPIVGDDTFCRQLVETRDRLVYTGEPFDAAAMHAIREKQIRQLVTPGTINAKLSSGGLVDCEYLVQGLQITYGNRFPELRTTNTREALRQLEACGILTNEDRITLRDCYRFLRSLIDALRMVRGDARDLTVPPFETEEFEYLARRLGYRGRSHVLMQELETVIQTVQELGRYLDGVGYEMP